MKFFKKILNLKEEMQNIAQLARPLVITQLAQVMVMATDTIMMGMLGAKALASGGLAVVIFSLLRTVGNGIVTAVSNIISYDYAKTKSINSVSETTKAGFWIATFLSMILGLFAWNIKPFLIWAHQDISIISDSVHYLRICMIGMFPCLWFLVLRNFTVGLKQPGKLMWITLISIFINIFLNFVLMFGYLGFPALGLMGIAWSTNVVFLITFLMFALSVIKNPLYARYKIFSHFFSVRIKSITHILHLGFSIAVTYVAESGFFMVIALLMGRISAVALAAHTIVNQCVYITFMIAVGISHAASMLIGHAYGEGNGTKVRRYAYSALIIGMACMGGTGIIFALGRYEIVHFFIQGNTALDQAVFQLATQLLCVAAVFQIFDGVQNITVGLLRGLKAMHRSMFISLIGYWLIGLPLAYFFGFRTSAGAVGIWWGLAMGLAATAILLIFSFWNVSQKKFREIQPIG